MKYTSIDEYIAHQPDEAQLILNHLRDMILNIAPYIEEKLSYGVPFFYYKGALCYLAMQKKSPYIGFVRGYVFANEDGLLETKGRKQVKSITFDNYADWEDKKQHLPAILQEALLIDEEVKSKKKHL